MSDLKIVQEIQVENPFNFGSADQQSRTVRTEGSLTREYIVNRLDTLSAALRTLPHALDDISQQFGINVYQNMMNDGRVAAAVNTLVSTATSQDGVVIPAVDQSHPEYDKALEIAKFMQRNIDDLNTPFLTINEQLLEGLWQGSAVAEITYKHQTSGEDRGKVVFKDIKKKPVKNTAFVVDSFNNVIGITNTNAITSKYMPYGSMIPIGSSVEPLDLKGVVPESNFMIFSWNSPAGDPRGQSILRPVYSAWWIKQQALQLWIEWSSKYAHPSIWATPPKEAIAECDENGNTISPTEVLAAQGRKIANATFAAFPYGTNLNLLQVNSDGRAFDLLIQYCNNEIMYGILNQTLATGESEHNSRAAAQVHQDALGVKIVKVKNQLGELWRKKFRFSTSLNFGDQYLHLTPKVDLGEGTGFPPSLTDIASILGKKEDGKLQFTDSEWKQFKKRFNLPNSEDIKTQDGAEGFIADMLTNPPKELSGG